MQPVVGNSKHGRSAELLRQLRYDLKFDPLSELIGIYRDPDTDNKERASIAKEVMSYVFPKLKAMEIDQKKEQPVIINLDLGGEVKFTKSTQPVEEEVDYAEAA